MFVFKSIKVSWFRRDIGQRFRRGRGRGGYRYNRERVGFGSGIAFGRERRSFDCGTGHCNKESGSGKGGFGQRNGNERTSGFNKSGGLGALESQNEQSNVDSMSKRFVLSYSSRREKNK